MLVSSSANFLEPIILVNDPLVNKRNQGPMLQNFFVRDFHTELDKAGKACRGQNTLAYYENP